jgi:hypothetical protein
MAYYGYTAQAPSYDFIAVAGQQLGQGVQNYLKDVQTKKDVKQAETVYQQIVDQATKKVKEADPTIEDNKATAFVVKHFPPLVGSEREEPVKAIERWYKADDPFEKAVNDLKVKATTREISQPSEQLPARTQAYPSGRVIAGAPIGGKGEAPQAAIVTPEQAREARIAGRFAPTTTTAGMVEEPERAFSPGMMAAEIRKTIDQRGLTGNQQLEAVYQRKLNEETTVPQGATEGTRAQVMGRALQQQGGWTPEQKEMYGAVPTEKDIMTNKRLEAAQQDKLKVHAENLKWRNRLANIREKKIGSDERLEIIKAKAENDVAKKRLEIQVKNIETGLTKAGKTWEGLDQAALQSDLDELKELKESLMLIEDNDELFNGLLKEKGGVRLQPAPSPTTPPSTPIGRRPLSAFER